MGAKRKYKWEEWFVKKQVTLIRGTDYECPQSTMVQQIRNSASIRGLQVTVTDLGDSISIRVRVSDDTRSQFPDSRN